MARIELDATDDGGADAFPQELAYRADDGLEVALLWTKDDNRLTVAVVDRKAGEAFALPIVDEPPLDVFYHPWAYAAARGYA